MGILDATRTAPPIRIPPLHPRNLVRIGESSGVNSIRTVTVAPFSPIPTRL